MRFPRFQSSFKNGFSLLELLVLIGIIAVLALVMTGGVRSLRERSQGVQCVANLKSLGVATTQYLGEHRGRLPIGLEETGGEKPTASWTGPMLGAWYWNLAPYLAVPRWETTKLYLGQQGQKVRAPNVFTCPAQLTAKERPIVFPTNLPVSYAPNSCMRPAAATRTEGESSLSQLNIAEVKNLSGKIWLSDSTFYNILNISDGRWLLGTDDPDAWPRHAFTRHAGAGNALFFDGHVETIPLTAILQEPLKPNLYRLFYPTREP
ncbi:MAG TPA: prepilin-type N-terminal cleavage/methylation domain-containing protein [Chthoniobacteraceae bacterium]|nr:prepilin-type N-terminal cleavage/methylation domain-containing protein [Chthoniobacteraceae bacterium]